MLLVLIACVPPSEDQARMGWLRDVLARDNEVWMTRDIALLEGKYSRMDADPFDFLRGTAAVFYADLARPDPTRAPTAFSAEPDVAALLLAGDPHAENFGTMSPDGAELRIEVTDLDGGSFGSYVLDTRRGALAVAMLASAVSGCDDDCREAAVSTYASAYTTSALAEQTGGLVCGRIGDGGLVDDLCAEAASDAATGDLMQKVSADHGSGRRFVLDAAVDETGRGLLAPSAEERAQIDRLLAGWSRRPDSFRVLDRARRFGVGVSSFPAVRYGVLWDLGDDGPADDALLNLREVVDPPGPPGRSPTVPVLFDSNAARIEEVAWLLWSRADADPLMAGLVDGGVTFKLTSWADTFQGFDHTDMTEARDTDLAGLASLLGRSLAACHTRGLRADGEPAGPWLAADLDGRAELFVEERLRDAEVDLARAEADRALFSEALATFGPRLGAETLVEDATR